jgi:hypothetical protein
LVVLDVEALVEGATEPATGVVRCLSVQLLRLCRQVQCSTEQLGSQAELFLGDADLFVEAVTVLLQAGQATTDLDRAERPVSCQVEEPFLGVVELGELQLEVGLDLFRRSSFIGKELV